MAEDERLAVLGGRRIGPHVPLKAGMVKAADRARAIGATAIQIFADNPTAWRRKDAAPVEVEAFRGRLVEHDIAPLAVHGPYLVNLAGSDEAFWERSVSTLVRDLAMAATYGAAAVNIHIGSHTGSTAAEGIARLARGIATIFDRLDGQGPGGAPGARWPRLVLENSAGGGDTVGSTVEDLARILEATVDAGIEPARMGFCLDMAHLWGAGHEVSRPDVLDSLLADFDARLGPDLLTMIHLNDSRALLGSRADRHQHIGAGLIGADGMRTILLHPRLRAVPTYFETPGMDEGYDAVNLDRIRLLLAGEPLPELPAEAFELRRRRYRSTTSPKPSSAAPEGT
jgi:deoxyribonuclease-4